MVTANFESAYYTFSERSCQSIIDSIPNPPQGSVETEKFCSKLARLARKFWLSNSLARLKLRSVSTIGYGDQVQACSKLARLARKFWLAKLARSLDSPLGFNTTARRQMYFYRETVVPIQTHHGIKFLPSTLAGETAGRYMWHWPQSGHKTRPELTR